MAGTLTAAGMVSLALGAVSGFLLALAVDSPDALRRAGVAHPARVRQLHLDWIVMGLVLVATATAVPGLPDWAGALVLVGAIVNPLLFVPLGFRAAIAQNRAYRLVTLASFVALSSGLVVAAAVAVGA
jgi:hydroxylaminobenzene mutase